MLLKTAEAPTPAAEIMASADRVASPIAAVPRADWRVEVYDDPADAEAAWDELDAAAPASLYQACRWLVPWLATVGKAKGLIPLIAVAYDLRARPLALFPFVTARRGPLTLAYFAGGTDSNANMGLIRPGSLSGPNEIHHLLRAAATAARRKPDAFVLLNQPEQFEGVANPLLQLPHQPSPSFSFAAKLDPTFEAFAARQMSSPTRKKLRKKRDQLQQSGAVEHRVAAGREEALAVLDVFFEQKLARFRDKHIDSVFEEPEARSFIEKISLDGIETGQAAIELHALKAGEKIVAIYGGGVHHGRFHAMFNSFDFSPEIARSSPGELLLMAMLEQKCAEGVTTFDLGIGEARYKASWCDLTEARFDSLVPVTAMGHAYVALEKLRLGAKRSIKQNPKLWALAQKLRTKL